MTSSDRIALGHWLTAAFTLLTGICALAIGLYMVNARQHVGANYTALVADVVRAQQHPNLLRTILNDLQEHPQQLNEQRLDNLMWRIPQHIAGVSHGLTASQLDPADYAPLLETLQQVEARLPEMERQIEAVAAGADPGALISLGYAVEDDLAWAYSELNDLIHGAAAEQRILMERLARIIGLLVLLVLLVVGGLMLALMRLHRQREQVARLSLADELTGLGNRRYLLNAAEQLHELSRRDETSLSLALIDLDHFKVLNDTWGHPAGDKVLEVFANTLLEATRQADVVTRIGGEEFCVLMPNTDAEGAYQLAERIRLRIGRLPKEKLGVATRLTVSLGIATGQGPDTDFDSLYSRADSALYQAKSSGRDRTCISMP
ncbi:GGDEF domain-containing protein [Billgrantia kenyensis]|uniref:diguanylate cyclase n=1 Tax=Billgrantia kenyensis TaxID=321266 RepID=A0A7V9W373_9GAMM|nr:GGDEF domain-containing protein [Halomonas kenyensis]MBA2780232.1 GGDEF domain-containing protein [Halomonas kenyensis]MCG6663112.1 GGDEF domain-containing protein [Halomonas kenyensis]